MSSGHSLAKNDRGFGETLELISDVRGWLSDAQARRLWDGAAHVPPGGRIVEIGSFRGRSTIVLATAAGERVEVIAIDPHGGGDRGPQEIAPDQERGQEDFVAFNSNLAAAGVSERVRHVREPSDRALPAVPGHVDLLYIDGAHRYRPARSDIERWGMRVRPGGTMMMHDAFNAIGVTLAQLRLLLISRQWRYVGRSGSLAEYRREAVSGLQLAAGAMRQLGDLTYFVRNMAIKVLIVARLRNLTRLLGHESGDWPF